jgi:hypothetical protein
MLCQFAFFYSPSEVEKKTAYVPLTSDAVASVESSCSKTNVCGTDIGMHSTNTSIPKFCLHFSVYCVVVGGGGGGVQ